MNHHVAALQRATSQCEPKGGVGVQVIIENFPSFGLLFGATDVVGHWWGDRPTVKLQLTVPSEAISCVASGQVTGSALVMSGGVRLDGTWADLACLHRVAAGSRFRAYTGYLAVTSAAVESTSTLLNGSNRSMCTSFWRLLTTQMAS